MRVSLFLLGAQVSVAALSQAQPAHADATDAARVPPLAGDATSPPDLVEPLDGVPRYQLTAPTFAPAGFQQKAGDNVALSISAAHGEMPAQTTASQAKPIDLGLVPIDYNLPDPNRGAANHFRALGGVTFANWINWQFAWLFMDMAYVTSESIARNIRIGFIWDDNSLMTNFFRHPYQGTMYYHAARGAGLSLWEASLYTAFGSLQWEFMGETHPAAPNDFYTTTLGGVAMGEMLYRLSSEVLDDSTSGSERFWRELGGGVLAPMRLFQRLTTGDAWASGPSHKNPTPIDFELDFGVDRVRSNDFGELDEFDPSFMVGLEVDYGDRLPKNDAGTFGPYEFFNASFSAALFNSELSGGRMFIEAVLHGWNSWLSEPDDPNPDNNIIGFSQAFDYANSNLLELGGTGVGIANWANWRFGKDMGFRLNGDVQWLAMSGATSPFTQATGRTYNFGMGMSGALSARLRLGRFGELGLFGKQYVVTVVDGEEGGELYGLIHGHYEIPIYKGLGLGFAPLWVYRYGAYKEVENVRSDSFETKTYVMWKI